MLPHAPASHLQAAVILRTTKTINVQMTQIASLEECATLLTASATIPADGELNKIQRVAFFIPCAWQMDQVLPVQKASNVIILAVGWVIQIRACAGEL